MRNGYILLHRQGLTQEEWKHPLRTLAWIDLLTMAAWEDSERDGRPVRRGEVVASLSFLAARWQQPRSTVYRWIKYWEAEQMAEHLPEQPAKQLPGRLFVVNYAKYQDWLKQVPEQVAGQVPKQLPRQIEKSNKKEIQELTNKKETYVVSAVTKSLHEYIGDLCAQAGIQHKVNLRMLDELVNRHRGLQLRVEMRKCVAWLIDHGKRDLSTMRLTNWFAKASEIQKRTENQRLEWLQAKKDPYVAAMKLKAAGKEPLLSDPALDLFPESK